MRDEMNLLTVTAGVSLMLLVTGCQGRALEAAASAQSARPSGQASAATSTEARVVGQVGVGSRPCTLWFDGSWSMDAAIKSAAVNQIVTNLPSIAALEDLGACEVYEWADKPWAATPFYKFALPKYLEPGREAVSCQQPSESEASKLFKPSRKRTEEEAAKVCAGLRATEEERYHAAAANNKTAYEKAMADAMDKLAATLIARPPLQASCTSVTDHLMRIARSRGPVTAISVTDAVETCRSVLSPVAPPAEDVRLIVVLVDPKTPAKPTLAAEFDHRQMALRRAAPWIDAVEPFWRFDQSVVARSGGATPAEPKKETPQ